MLNVTLYCKIEGHLHMIWFVSLTMTSFAFI